MNSPLGEQLKDACRDNDLVLVEQLTSDPSVNVNWHAGGGYTPFYNACYNGHLSVVQHLLRHPKLQPNIPNHNGATPYFVACENGHTDVVQLLLGDPRIDVNMRMIGQVTPFFMACQGGRASVVRLLLTDPRTDPNVRSIYASTPLWVAACHGRLEIVQQLLAAEAVIDTSVRTIAGQEAWNRTTAAEWARRDPGLSANLPLPSDVLDLVRAHGTQIAELIEAYEEDWVAVRARLRCLPGIRERHIGFTFATVVSVADSYFALSATTLNVESSVTASKCRRFIRIATLLPLDLQMVLCNRMFGFGGNIVKTKDSEPGFRWLFVS